MSADVQFVGGPEAAADIGRWADQLGEKIAKAAEPFADRLAAGVAARVPHLSGQLASTADASAPDDGVELSLGGSLAYAGWIEFGGSRGRTHIPQGRYLYPTALEAVDEFARVAADAASDSAARFSW